MRNLCDVIDQIIPLVRNDESCVAAELEKIKTSVSFAAPEMAGYWWGVAAGLLMETVGKDHPNYVEVLRIWNGTRHVVIV